MSDPTPEFSRLIAADHVSPNGTAQDLEAKPAERAGLAKRFGLVDLKSLKAELTLTPGREKTIAVEGVIKCDVVQTCVLTLEPITAHLNISVDVVFMPAGQHREGAGSPHLEEDDDEFETFYGNKIDLGEMVAQHVGINLDPYPRKPNAKLTKAEFGPKVEKVKPLAKLVELNKKPKK